MNCFSSSHDDMLKSFQCASTLIFIFIVAYLDDVYGIIGGTFAKHGEYPYIASLQWDNRHKCGGALIEEDTVLTVAHCIPLLYVNRTQKHRATVLLGVVNQKSPDNGSRRIGISNIKFLDIHPFNFSTISTEALEIIPLPHFPYDYAMLTLAEKVQETPLIQVGRIAPAGMPKLNTICTILGWGRYQYPDVFPKRSNNFSALLREGRMYVTSPQVLGKLPKTMMVIQPILNGSDDWFGSPCFGDSGSPVICTDSTNNSYIAGLLEAAKIPCDDMRALAVAMRLDVIRDWIRNDATSFKQVPASSLMKVGFFTFFIFCAVLVVMALSL